MPSKRFKKGDEVLGMWPGSRMYFKGKIVDVDEGTYDVKFEEGTTYTLLEKHVKSVSMLRQVEARTEKHEKSTRNRSSSFSRSRSRSRSRTPSRAVEKTPRRSKRLENSPKKPAKEEATEIEEPEPEEIKPVLAEEGPRRRSARIAAKVVSAPITPSDHVDGEPRDNGVVKTEETTDQKVPEDKKPEEERPRSEDEYTVGTFRAIILLLSAPLLMWTLHALCIQHGGRLMSLPSVNLDLVSFVDRRALFVLLGFYVFGFLPVLLPLGKVMELNGSIIRCNGIYVALVEIMALYALKHYFHVQASTVQELYSKFLLPAIGVGVLGALVAFLKRTKQSKAGLVYDSIMGTDVTVTVGGINVKHFLMRTGLLASIAINLIQIEANFESNGRYSPTLVFTCTLQSTYFLLALWLEGSLPYSFEYSHETFGLAISMAYATFPLLATLSSYVVAVNQREIDATSMLLIALVFLIGFVVLHGSITQKALFRSNPENPQFAEAETLTSPSGKKLLLSGWWGWMRHPNYFGDLLIYIAQVLPCGMTLSVPHLLPLLTFLVMLDRIKRVEKQCKKQHGPAWDRYCERVKYRLLPGIF